jgi:hypothetical protein
LPPRRLRQWLRSERWCGNSCRKNSSPVKCWKYGSIDPAFAHAFVGQSVNMLEQNSPITNCVAIPGRPLSLYSGAISPSTKDLVQPRAEPDPVVSCFFGRIAPPDAAADHASRFEGIAKTKLRASRASDTETNPAQKRLSLTGLEGRRGRCPSTIGLLRKSSPPGYARRSPTGAGPARASYSWHP